MLPIDGGLATELEQRGHDLGVQARRRDPADRAIEQFLTNVYWGDLDYLLVDLPPGTGDVAISLGQLLPTAKTVVVTTPQVASAEVAERSGSVGLQTGQAVFGVIENMAWLVQPDGSKLELFGRGGGQAVRKAAGGVNRSACRALDEDLQLQELPMFPITMTECVADEFVFVPKSINWTNKRW